MKPSHYVNNQDFFNAFLEYKEALSKKEDGVKVPIPDYIGLCILTIAKRFSSSPKFCGYSYREEMISDAIENCILYINNFNPEKSKNPFAYFTQICYYAFIRRIMKEKKQCYIKGKIIEKMPFDTFSLQSFDESDAMEKNISFLQSHNAFDGGAFERKIERAKKKRKTVIGLETLFEV